MEVQGRYTGNYSNVKGGFQYQYTCQTCSRVFTDSAPTTTAPVCCHGCYSGARSPSGNVDNRQRCQRGVRHSQPSGRRKAKHKHTGEST